jgi:hypothetical protein
VNGRMQFRERAERDTTAGGMHTVQRESRRSGEANVTLTSAGVTASPQESMYFFRSWSELQTQQMRANDQVLIVTV